MDEADLSHYVVFRDAADSAFANEVHGLNTLYGAPSGTERTIAHSQSHSPLYISVVLFHDVIQEPALAQVTTARQHSFGFQFLESRWIGAVLVDIDHAWREIAQTAESSTKEAFGRVSISKMSSHNGISQLAQRK